MAGLINEYQEEIVDLVHLHDQIFLHVFQLAGL